MKPVKNCTGFQFVHFHFKQKLLKISLVVAYITMYPLTLCLFQFKRKENTPSEEDFETIKLISNGAYA